MLRLLLIRVNQNGSKEVHISYITMVCLHAFRVALHSKFWGPFKYEYVVSPINGLPFDDKKVSRQTYL